MKIRKFFANERLEGTNRMTTNPDLVGIKATRGKAGFLTWNSTTKQRFGRKKNVTLLYFKQNTSYQIWYKVLSPETLSLCCCNFPPPKFDLSKM